MYRQLIGQCQMTQQKITVQVLQPHVTSLPAVSSKRISCSKNANKHVAMNINAMLSEDQFACYTQQMRMMAGWQRMYS